jgi:hypothetical protein
MSGKQGTGQKARHWKLQKKPHLVAYKRLMSVFASIFRIAEKSFHNSPKPLVIMLLRKCCFDFFSGGKTHGTG